MLATHIRTLFHTSFRSGNATPGHMAKTFMTNYGVELRTEFGRDEDSTVAIADSQSVKTTEKS